ncbi:MAG: hypothetical protein A3F09_05040 [Chlamydiae bacterium RIFCSPHIGHO2_12_FULL_49_11]|nr:MAG: hypothetical protein A3F09_05040 [Chlamydiae bacterium RIFCSPHIGHO2_12_FULL_49_11]
MDSLWLIVPCIYVGFLTVKSIRQKRWDFSLFFWLFILLLFCGAWFYYRSLSVTFTTLNAISIYILILVFSVDALIHYLQSRKPIDLTASIIGFLLVFFQFLIPAVSRILSRGF